MTDQFDVELRDRLARVAAAIPVEPPSLMGSVANAPVHTGPAMRLAFGGLVPILAVAVIGILLVGLAKVGPFAPGASDAPGASVINGPVVATTRSGDFELTIRSERARYLPDEPIKITASLVYGGVAGPIAIAHAPAAGGGPIGFGITEPVIGDLVLTGLMRRQSCVATTLAPLETHTVAFAKSGGFDGSNPRSGEYDAFMSDPILTLQKGVWHPYAIAQFTIDDCGGATIEIRAEIEIEVVAAQAEASTRPTPAGVPVVASTTDQGFELVLRSQKGTYARDEPIEFSAALTYEGSEPAVAISHALGAQSTPIAFGVTESVLGLQLAPIYESACVRSTLDAGIPIVQPFAKSASWSSLGPAQRQFLFDPALRLPEGTWHIFAVAEFSVGDCGADPIKLRVEIRIEVGAAGAEPSEPTTSPTTGPSSSAIPTQPDGSVLGVATDGLFELRLRAVSGTGFAAHTPIDLFTTYAHVGIELPGSVTVGHFQPEIAFAIEQLGVENNLIRSKVYDSNCSERELVPGVPATVPYRDGNLLSIKAVTVGGSFNAALGDGFLSLPVGRWRISVYLDTYLGGCQARSEAGHHTLETSIEIDVIAAASVEIVLRTASGPHAGLCMTAIGGGTLARNPRTGLGFEDGGIVTDVIWPYGWTARVEGEDVVLYDSNGDVEAVVGEHISVGGGHTGANDDPFDTFAICGGPVISHAPN